MRPAIRAEGLSKRYRIGASRGGYRTLRETIMDAAVAPVHRFRSLLGMAPAMVEPTEHWALRDISFEVQPGEVVGIVGRNGAGKSTLLKILSRITEPTTGRAELHGRVVSLLEVGTGFHHELTGRENVYLNGAILGMSRREIDRKFDDIVAFSEVGKFLDTPAKFYSSGMYVRLAFAVAAHLDPEILIVDEVLAVGDAAFQKKCLDRIQALGKGGGTVLFVSHNMGTVASLCQRAVVLDQGRVIGHGEARQQVRDYIALLNLRATSDLAGRTDRAGNGAIRVVDIKLLGAGGRPVDSVLAGEPLTLRFEYRTTKPVLNAEIHAWVCNDQGNNVTMLSSRLTGDVFEALPEAGAFECELPEVTLAPGAYLLNYKVNAGLDAADEVQAAARLDVEPGPFFPSGRTPGSHQGAVLTRHHWRVCP